MLSNIALAIGADSMIHLVVRVRALAAAGVDTPWPVAVTQIGRPVLGASAIIIAGFGIFVLSSFPPVGGRTLAQAIITSASVIVVRYLIQLWLLNLKRLDPLEEFAKSSIIRHMKIADLSTVNV